MQSPSSLHDIRVLDLSRVLAGPYCSMLLGDYGADVLKVERPHSGDDTRRWGPPWVEGESAYFLSVNRNKRSLALNIKHPKGQQVLRELVAQSDILLENFKTGTLDAWGLDYPTLSKKHPRLIYCSISGYGRTGPQAHRPGYDFAVQAEGGIMSITGPADGEPHKVGVAIVDITAGLFATTAILAALHHRDNTGQGQYIDVSLLDSQVAWLANIAQDHLLSGNIPQRRGNAHAHIVPYETFPTSDGHLALAIGNDGQYQKLCQVLERPDLWDNPSYQTNASRVALRNELVPQLQQAFQTRPTQDWLDLLLDAGLPAGSINNLSQVFAHPQIQAREMLQSVEHPTIGSLPQVGPVAKMSTTPASIRSAPPLLGADTATVLHEWLDYSDEQIHELAKEQAIALSPTPSH
ncbi:MAG: CoA transferase [Deltaproteobacteria bacterium]|nr:MAG: CoA transferase [Deltaproteobacteria bacterium]